ncbi:bacterio-opsin activator domain-containing protein [Halohasta salina]|uniref:bacterio-opsin activator domain-containing protein n=1 Tax=Halohasta salina TaxID=2961621 RepID=UPI0020A3BEB0|nr:bacterio-opsin activator domain-containing protein [Halohasta salina]
MSRSIRVLYVDDDPQSLDVIPNRCEAVSELRFETESRPRTVTEQLHDDLDCLITDYRMPSMDGIELLTEVSNQQPDLPILLLTGHGGGEIASEALQKGATEYMEKSTAIAQPDLLANRVRNAVEQMRREKTNRALATDANRFIRATSPTAVYEAAVDLTCETLGFEDAAVVEDTPEGWSVVAHSGLDASLRSELPTAEPLAAAVDSDEPVVAESGAVEAIDTASCWVPLGSHGVLVGRTAEADTDVDYLRDAILIVATNAESALTRLEQAALLDERKRELERQRTELASLRQTNEVIRSVNRAITSVRSQREIERLVCERLVGDDRYTYAWIGEYDLETDRVTPRAKSGLGAAVTVGSAVSLADRYSAETLETVIDHRQVAVEAPTGPESIPGSASGSAVDAGTSVLVPIVHNEVLYDVLIVHSADHTSVGHREQDVLAELGETIGYALRTAEQRRALVGDSDTEVVFEIGCESDHLIRLSAAADCTVSIESLSTRSDGRLRQFVLVEGTDPDSFRSYADRTGIDDPTVLVEREGCFVATLTTDGSPVVDCIAEQGVSLTAFSATEGRGTVSMTVPKSTDIRALAERFESALGWAELRAKRQLDTAADTPQGFREQLEEALTDRQHETLQAAYHAGFFAWPRTNTGEAIADRLGIAGPTFLQHLRAGERKLLEALFEQDRPVYN